MTSNGRWFVIGEVPNSPYTRYGILKGNTVVEVTISRPDGDPVDRPNPLKWNVAPPFGRMTGMRYTFNNVPHAKEERSRRNAGEKLIAAAKFRRVAKAP